MSAELAGAPPLKEGDGPDRSMTNTLLSTYLHFYDVNLISE
jgi:hypothetical protein